MHIKSRSKWINMSDPSASEIPNFISIETPVFREKFGNSGSLNLQVPEPEELPKNYRDVPCHSRKASAQSGALTGGGAEVHVLEYESGYDNEGRPSFEFCKGDKGGYKAKVISFLKPSSKWDDAEKWLVNVSQNEFNPKGKINGGVIPTTEIALNSMKKVDFSNQATDNLQNGSHELKNKPSNYVAGFSSTVESSRDLMQESFFGDFPGEKMKKVDTIKCLSNTGNTGAHFAFKPALASLPSQARLNASSDCFSTGDQTRELNMACEKDSKITYLEPISWVEKPSSECVISERVISNGANEAPLSPQSTSSYLMATSSVRSISMRDMGTEMTPIASQEPSRTGTPIRATTPAMCSPVSSNPSTPRRAIPVSKTSHDFVAVSGVECNMIPSAFSEKDIKIETNQEAFCFDGQIRKTKMMPWTNKEEEDEDASKLLKKIDLEEVKKTVLETRAAAWEAAEQAKNMARYKREEGKIKAWENHERSKAEAEMRRIEAKIERMRSHAHEKLINQLAATQERAEERLATAEARRLEHAAKTAERADHIRRTGHLPSSFMCGLCD